MEDRLKKALADSGAVISGSHIVYKAGKHGTEYIDKDRFAKLGGKILADLIRSVAENAVNNGLSFPPGTDRIGIIGPAMGAISYTLVMAEYLENLLPNYSFFPARTELESGPNNKKIHVIPDKLAKFYRGALFIGIEDIVNSGTTIREVGSLVSTRLAAQLYAAMSVVDRGGQTNETLGIKQYFPYARVNMHQVDPRVQPCPDCKAGVPINIDLGRGKEWVGLFGQPPYAPDQDFSAFPWEKPAN